MTVRIVAFARIREILGAAERVVALPEGTRVGDLWPVLAAETPAFAAFETSTRIARNGRIAAGEEPLQDGDEIALLPPVGGG